MNTAALFSGQPLPRGGLSNEAELAEACPDTFKERGNRWVDYVANPGKFPMDKLNGWQWKSSDLETRERQLECFGSVLDAPHNSTMKLSARNMIAGWMLSEMLEAVPST